MSAIVGTDRSDLVAVTAAQPADGFYRPGEVVAGRYVVRELIGSGPLGAVYRTENQESGAVVALRVVWPDLLPDDASRGRFLKECIRARSVQNRYVAPVYEAFIHEVSHEVSHEGAGQIVCVLAVKHLPGPTLSSRVGRRLQHGVPLLALEAQPIVSQIGVGLSAIHRMGLVHGNLRAANIYFAGDEIRIGDLGLASALPVGIVALAEANAGRGGGRAPEAAAGRRCTPASDVYAFAVLTARMLGLLSPRSAEEVPVPPSVRVVLRRALSRHPRDRYADVDTFAGALVTAFERIDQRTSVGLRAVTPNGDLTPRIRTFRPQRSAQRSDVVAGALESPSSPATGSPSARTPPRSRAAASVVVDPGALYSETPSTLPPLGPVRPIPLRKVRRTGASVQAPLVSTAASPAAWPATPRRTPHAPPAPPGPPAWALAVPAPAARHAPAPMRQVRERARGRVPLALVLVLTLAATSLAGAIVRNLVAGSVEERLAEERVAKAEILRQADDQAPAAPPHRHE